MNEDWRKMFTKKPIKPKPLKPFQKDMATLLKEMKEKKSKEEPRI